MVIIMQEIFGISYYNDNRKNKEEDHGEKMVA